MDSTSGAMNRLAWGCAVAAIATFSYGIVVLAALHVLRPDYAPASNFVSNYAVGPYGWVMSTFFISFSFGLALLVTGLFASGIRGMLGLAGFAALLVTAAGLIVTAIYPADLPGAPYTRSGDIHELSFRVNVIGILVGVFCISAALGADALWRGQRRMLWTLAVVVAAALVIQFATLRKGLPYGIANRFFVVTVFAWMGFVADRLRRTVPTQTGQAVR